MNSATSGSGVSITRYGTISQNLLKRKKTQVLNSKLYNENYYNVLCNI